MLAFAIQSLNIVRIISLFYMGQWSQVMFDWFHLYLWQALIVLDALAVWLIWLRYLPKRKRLPPPAQDSELSSPEAFGNELLSAAVMQQRRQELPRRVAMTIAT